MTVGVCVSKGGIFVWDSNVEVDGVEESGKGAEVNIGLGVSVTTGMGVFVSVDFGVAGVLLMAVGVVEEMRVAVAVISCVLVISGGKMTRSLLTNSCVEVADKLFFAFD